MSDIRWEPVSWVTLDELPPGCVFVTQDGVLAVKSEYKYNGEFNSQWRCILLASGEYAHFEQGNSTLVAAVEIATPVAAPMPLEMQLSAQADELMAARDSVRVFREGNLRREQELVTLRTQLEEANRRIAELELANERLTASADPEALVIVYGKGVSDERNRWRQKKEETTND